MFVISSGSASLQFWPLIRRRILSYKPRWTTSQMLSLLTTFHCWDFHECLNSHLSGWVPGRSDPLFPYYDEVYWVYRKRRFVVFLVLCASAKDFMPFAELWAGAVAQLIRVLTRDARGPGLHSQRHVRQWGASYLNIAVKELIHV